MHHLCSSPKYSRDCNTALSEYADLRCRTLTGLHFRESAVPDTSLRSEDPTAWEAALLGASLAHEASTVVWDEGEKGGEGKNVQGDDRPGQLDMGLRHELDRIRSKLVSLRDAVWTGSKTLQIQYERADGLDLADLQRSEFHPSQQRWRRNVGESEPEKTCYSWTVHSQDGCHIEEVLRGEASSFRLHCAGSQQRPQAGTAACVSAGFARLWHTHSWLRVVV